MTPYNKDKTLSTILILLTCAAIIFGIGTSEGVQNLGSRTLKDIVYYLFDFYPDILLISYVFICLQITGYVELKYKQDNLTISLLSIVFTPLLILFVLQNGNEDD